MARQKAEARKAWAGSGEAADESLWFQLRDELGATEFLGYDTESAEGNITAIIKDGAKVEIAKAGETVRVLTNQTPFYGESGGQIGDHGAIFSADGGEGEVIDTEKKLGSLHIHVVKLTGGAFRIGEAVELRVDGERRRATRANHSATHLLHAALKRVLGPHVSQKGSMVGPERLRFDFSHPKAVSTDEIETIESQVNSVVRQNSDVSTRLMQTDEAIEAGAEALFGEKYGDEVRVLTMGDDEQATKPYSVELCGGTHVRRLGDIGMFTILSESAVAAGVRRIEAMTSEGARRYLSAQAEIARDAAAALKTSAAELPARVAQLTEERRRLEKELADAKRALALAGPASGDGAGGEVEKIGAVSFLYRPLVDFAPKELKGIADEAKVQIGSGVVVIANTANEKVSLVIGVTDDLSQTISAGDLVKLGSAKLGGKGGGRPDMAQGGGPEIGKLADAVEAIKQQLSGVAAS
jgi:alanyl-tRNA synthetase